MLTDILNRDGAMKWNGCYGGNLVNQLLGEGDLET